MAVFCSRCGKPLPEGAAFCASCGSVISAGATAAAGTPAGSTGAAAVLAPASTGAPALYAGFWRRLGAFLIDGIIIGIVMTPFGLGLWGTIAGIVQVSHDSPEALAANPFACEFRSDGSLAYLPVAEIYVKYLAGPAVTYRVVHHHLPGEC